MVKFNIGSRAEVMHGTAKKTGGGLRKKDLKYNKRGKIVSKKASKTAKNNNNLIKAGYITKKGVFGVFKIKGGANSDYSDYNNYRYNSNNYNYYRRNSNNYNYNYYRHNSNNLSNSKSFNSSSTEESVNNGNNSKNSKNGNNGYNGNNGNNGNNGYNGYNGNNDNNANNRSNEESSYNGNNDNNTNNRSNEESSYNSNNTNNRSNEESGYNGNMENNIDDILIRFKQLMIYGKPSECIKYGSCNSIGYILQNFFETYTKVSTKIAKFENNENLTLDNISLMLFDRFIYNISKLINLINVNNLSKFLKTLFGYKFDYSKFKIFTSGKTKILMNYNFNESNVTTKYNSMYIDIPDTRLMVTFNIETNTIIFHIGSKTEKISFNKTDINIEIEEYEDNFEHNILYLHLFFYSTTNVDMIRYTERYKEIIKIIKRKIPTITNTNILYSFELPGFILFILKQMMKKYNYAYISSGTSLNTISKNSSV